MKNIITWNVQGMHCASCERVIEQELRSLPGVLDAEVSLSQKRAGVELSEHATEPDFSAAFNKLKQLGYSFQRERASQSAQPSTSLAGNVCVIPAKTPLSARLMKALIALAIVGLIGGIILSPILKRIPSIDASASLIALFGFGLIASLSSCLASTGGYLLAYSSQKPSRRRTLSIHVGRLFAFGIGGAFLGAIGKGIPTLGSGFYGALSLILGIGFFFVGLNLLEITPSLASLGIRIPKKLSRLADEATKSDRKITPFIVGASTFILPCGFTQTAQALALASGNPVRGMLIMLAFAVGTLPVLAGLTSFGSLATLKHHTVRLATGSILVLFAISQINGGLTIMGSPVTPGTMLSSMFRGSQSNSPVVAQAGSKQVLQMAVTSSGYQPSTLTVKVGVPVQWEIDGQNVAGCTRDIVVPSLHIEKTLTKGQNIIAFTPTKTGTIPFSCGMGMVRGSINVIN